MTEIIPSYGHDLKQDAVLIGLPEVVHHVLLLGVCEEVTEVQVGKLQTCCCCADKNTNVLRFVPTKKR